MATYTRKPSTEKAELLEEAARRNLLAIPDPKKHQTISFIKSGIRILGYFLLPVDLLLGAGVLILSEIVGIYEELV